MKLLHVVTNTPTAMIPSMTNQILLCFIRLFLSKINRYVLLNSAYHKPEGNGIVILN
ncbi:hypothetical protein [Hungatella hathewayi]|uniref:hypothetical protein n=1 Tax=Hungatella hathewayi TaxID=154046 RepID=UPI001651F575|nr:hypothetical protein [Hungatella hathewayi]